MEENPYTPHELPLLTSGALERTLSSYMELLSILDGADSSEELERMRRQLAHALAVIEAELHRRGHRGEA